MDKFLDHESETEPLEKEWSPVCCWAFTSAKLSLRYQFQCPIASIAEKFECSPVPC